MILTCTHMASMKLDQLVDSYKIILRFYVSKATNFVERMQRAVLHCFDCGKITSCSTLLACLECVHISCYDLHLVDHHKEKEHNLYVDLSRGRTYCCACDDYIFDPIFEALRIHGRNVDLAEISECFQKIKFGRIRGMVNVNNYTCYINCIMQVFVHTPAVRDYAFADKHVCHIACHKECAVCTLVNVFQEYFCEDEENKESICLSGIVYVLWRTCFSKFMPNQQQDALDFYTDYLKCLHRDVTPCLLPSGHASCKCSFHNLFYVRTRTDLVCENCQYVSSSTDETLDHISLVSLLHNSDLLGCLNETLNKKETSLCTKCETTGINIRQVTFMALPLVLVIQVNRPQNGQNNKKRYNRKDCPTFPTELDMSPYIIGCNDANSQTSDNKYILYGVVLHEGDQNAGHYFSYIMKKYAWFKCTDETVREVSQNEALQSQGYLLFFHKATYVYKKPQS